MDINENIVTLNDEIGAVVSVCVFVCMCVYTNKIFIYFIFLHQLISQSAVQKPSLNPKQEAMQVHCEALWLGKTP